MEYNIRRAIIRLLKKNKTPKETHIHINKSSEFGSVSYNDILDIRNEFLHKKVIGGYKRCNICWCEHPYTYEVFWYNGYRSDWSRRLHSTCLASRWRIKKNIIIMKDKRYEWMIKSNTKSRKKNKKNRTVKKINDLTPEEQEKRREARRIYNKKRYGKKKNK